MSDILKRPESRPSVINGRIFENKKGEKTILVRVSRYMDKSLLHIQGLGEKCVLAGFAKEYARFAVSGHDAISAGEVIEQDSTATVARAERLERLTTEASMQEIFSEQSLHAQCVIYQRDSNDACVAMPLYFPSKATSCKVQLLLEKYNGAGAERQATLLPRHRDHLNFVVQTGRNQLRMIALLLNDDSLTDDLKQLLATRRAQLNKHLTNLAEVEAMRVSIA